VFAGSPETLRTTLAANVVAPLGGVTVKVEDAGKPASTGAGVVGVDRVKLVMV
jgi:hypothetical protein